MAALQVIQNPALTMSSREIAELCGKLHGHVMRDIRAMLDVLGQSNFGLAGFEWEYSDSQGKPRLEYRLDKELTLTLVAGYSVELRNRIIKRWLELEAQAAAPAFQVPQTMGEALRLAAELTDKVKKQPIGIEA